jgi:hypothetical protein
MPHPLSVTPEPYRPPTREEIERAREMYAAGFTVSRILAATDMSLGTFYHWLDGGPSGEGSPLYPPMPRRRTVVGKRRKALTDATRVSLAARLWRTAERQARDIEERLARPSQANPERERDVRMLGVLVRSLRELSAFDRGEAIVESAHDDGAADNARERAFRAERLRNAEETASILRQVMGIMRDASAAIKAAQGNTAAREAKAEETAAHDAELRERLERRINAVCAQMADERAEKENHGEAVGGGEPLVP